MNSNTELRATLNMILARLNDDSGGPHSSAEWEVIAGGLVTALRYARKTSNRLAQSETA